MKKTFMRTLSFLLACLTSLACLPLIIPVLPAMAAGDPIFSALPSGMVFTDADDTILSEDSSVNVGDTFTISAVVKTTSSSGIQVLFGKGSKTRGHYEIWLYNGSLSFYAPEINYDSAIYPDAFIADGNEHKFTFTYNHGEWRFYLDNVKKSEGDVLGSISDIDAQISIGSLIDGTYEYIGELKDLKIYDYCTDAGASSNPAFEAVDKLVALENGKNFAAGADSVTEPTKTVNVGSAFTLAAFMKSDAAYGTQVLFAKGPKLNGHYEVWLYNGTLAFYAPEINNGNSIYTGALVADGKDHHIAFTIKDDAWYAYVDGALKSCGLTTGTVSDKDRCLTFGSLEDGGFEYLGTLKNVLIQKGALTPSQIMALVPENMRENATYEPSDRESTYTPVKTTATEALRGVDRLENISALPYADLSATTGYEGSISKFGDNADWDWSIYKDDKGEYVLFETYGAGCLYNFTQHRYPSSEEPTFHFYLDDSNTPAFSIKQSEFGRKAPFLSPVADIYEGPSDGGRGPIWVIRSFVPMEFTSYCKVTSTVELLGSDKYRGEGGWGHVTYLLYDDKTGLETFDPEKYDGEILSSISKNVSFDPKYSKENITFKKQEFTLEAGGSVTILDYEGDGSVASVKLKLLDEHAAPANLSDIRLRMYWDGADTPAVDAPIGTFFGNEYGYTQCDNALLMVGTEIAPFLYFRGYNYYPMPFWKNAKIELYSKSSADITVAEVEVQVTPASVIRYDKNAAGYFTSSKYYEKTKNTYGNNSLIAEVEGTGHMVYGVLSGYSIGAGCEGDVRVFFDGRLSPEIESDGSESWASYGWGFVTPPESNPFSGYNGMYSSNSDWSEVRLTLGDSYFFKSSLRFELEHGSVNEGMGSHSGQIFYYLLADENAKSSVTDSIDLSNSKSKDDHTFHADGELREQAVNSAYANGLDSANSFAANVYYPAGSISFDVKLASENTGVLLNRTFSQKEGRQAAEVYVDGTLVTERIWYYVDYNTFYNWADDSFRIPAKYTEGKDTIRITIKPVDLGGGKSWNAASFEVISIIAPEAEALEDDPTQPSGGDEPSTGGDDKPQSPTDPESGSNGESSEPTAPKTGENALLPLLVMMVAALSAGYIFYFKKATRN